VWLALASGSLSAQAVLPGDEPNGQYSGYWSWPAMVETVEGYAAAHPELVRIQGIGSTHEGREILAVEVAAPDGPAERPELLFMAGIHPREQPPQVALMSFMDELVSGYGSDERVTRLLETRRVWFIPVLNVDGKVYDFANGNGGNQGANWRVSRRPFENGRHGVDLNRNGLVGWGSASDIPGSGTYHGPGPLSEPEVQALFDFMERRPIRLFLDVHSSLEAYLVPPHLVSGDAERYQHLVDGMRLRQRGPYRGGPRRAGTEARADEGTGAGQTHATGFYVHGAYSFVFEIGPPGDPARFYPTRDEIDEHYRRNVREPWFFLLEEAGGLPEPRLDGGARLDSLEVYGPLRPGHTLELRPRITGPVDYGVLVSRTPGVRVTGEYRLYPLESADGHRVHLPPKLGPGTHITLELYLWDRHRQRTVIELPLTLEGID
jgi:carboxypeptidase T